MKLYDRMTVRRNRFLVNKTNRCTEFQIYWYYCLHVSGSLSARHQDFLTVHRLWYILCSCDEPFPSRSRLDFHPTPGSKLSSQLHKMYESWCKSKNWWWTERLSETCRIVIPIKLEFSASVGFIHKVLWSIPAHLLTCRRDVLTGKEWMLRQYGFLHCVVAVTFWLIPLLW
jgi:hypothetical protein